MSALITCIGEALIDFLPINEGERTVGFRMHPGGSLLNVAVAAARLGQPVALATRVSTDLFGRFLRGYVASEGVDTRWLLDIAAPSSLAFVANVNGDPSFSFYGEGAADTMLRIEDLPETLFRETAVLHVGSISLLRGTTPATVRAAAERLHGRALISLDPNVRPGLVGNELAYRRLIDRLVGLADLVKVSAADLAWLAPGRELALAAGDLLAQGPALVVVTQGEAGVLALRATADGAQSIRLPAFPVAVADTVGAGDSFNAGLLAQLLERGVASRAALLGLPSDALNASLRFAAAVAALNCTRPGSDPPSRAGVEAFLSSQ